MVVSELNKINSNESKPEAKPIAEDISDSKLLSGLGNAYEWLSNCISATVKFALSGRRNRILRRLNRTAEAVMAMRESMLMLTDEQLKSKTDDFRERLKNGATLDDISTEAFAVAREAARRVLGEEHYKVQIMGGMALHMGMIAEMKTGEGKTLVSVLPAYLNALSGLGVHVITVNDYLARRDSEWMGKVFEFLGLTVGCVDGSGDMMQKKQAYHCDITYCTNNEIGFDYLRDNMAMHPSQVCQRPFNFCIIDEADSILIDEARTPLIISGEMQENRGLDYTSGYKFANKLVAQLEPKHYKASIKEHQVTFTEEGLDRLEELIEESQSDKANWGHFSLDTCEVVIGKYGLQPVMIKAISDYRIEEIAFLLDKNNIKPTIINNDSEITQEFIDGLNKESVVIVKQLPVDDILKEVGNNFAVLDVSKMSDDSAHNAYQKIYENLVGKYSKLNVILLCKNNDECVRLGAYLNESGIKADLVKNEEQLYSWQQASSEPGIFLLGNIDVSPIKNAHLSCGKIFTIDSYGAKEYLYCAKNSTLLHNIMQALRAHKLYRKDIDYVVDRRKKGGEIKIVDEHTGRILHGRRYSDCLHQAIEAKEDVYIRPESRVVASITYQKLFALYPTKSGMTGTAMTEADEFEKVFYNYNKETGARVPLYCIDIPTNVPVKRIDYNDLVFRNKSDKIAGIVEQVRVCHEKGQPIIVGALNVQDSEEIGQHLLKANFKIKILNATNHKEEANIIANAGRYGAITVVTNMAGRGTDIKLGGDAKTIIKLLTKDIEDPEKIESIRAEVLEEVAENKKKVLEVGGLYVIAMEHNSNRRIDNQLKGRSGRQGDPGEFRCFVCPNDELFSKFDFGARLENMMEEGESIEFGMLTKTISDLQKRTESHNFGIRQWLKRYSDIKESYMMQFYDTRHFILYSNDQSISTFMRDKFNKLVLSNEENFQNFINEYGIDVEDTDELCQKFNRIIDARLLDKSRFFGRELIQTSLKAFDDAWQKYYIIMSHAREAISFQRYAEKDDLVSFSKVARERFTLVMNQAYYTIFGSIFNDHMANENVYRNVGQDVNAQINEQFDNLDFLKGLQSKFSDLNGIDLEKEEIAKSQQDDTSVDSMQEKLVDIMTKMQMLQEQFKLKFGDATPSAEEFEGKLSELIQENSELTSILDSLNVDKDEFAAKSKEAFSILSNQRDSFPGTDASPVESSEAPSIEADVPEVVQEIIGEIEELVEKAEESAVTEAQKPASEEEIES